MKRRILILIGFTIFSQIVVSQNVREDNFIAFGANYGIEVPFGDIADRFGQNFRAGVSLDLFKNKSNSIISLEGFILFSDNVKEDALFPLRQSNGAILGSNGAYVDVFLRQRGTYVGLNYDKIILPRSSNNNSGLAVGLGIGVLQHNIRFQIDSNNAPQFKDDYGKGYDRNTMGFAAKQKISYLHIGKSKSVNYEIALTITEGFTKLTRGVNFDTGLPDNKSRLDILVGLNFKWMIPFSSPSAAQDEYFY